MSSKTQYILAIINPAAGSRSAPQVKEALSTHFSEQATDFTVYETTGEEDLPQVVVDYLAGNAFDMVLAAGGDGTISEVANGMEGADIPLGIIPAGTSNAIAQELNLPLDIDKSVKMYGDNPQTRIFDAIKVDGRHFILHVSVGLNAQIMNTSRELKNQVGMFAYIWTLVSELRNQPVNRYNLKVDGVGHQVKGIELLLANAAALGLPSLHWGEQIDPGDGVIDICIVRPRKFTDYFSLFYDVLRRRPQEDRFISYLSARSSILVESGESSEIDTSGDGESLSQTPLQAHVVPNFVTLLAPPSGRQS